MVPSKIRFALLVLALFASGAMALSEVGETEGKPARILGVLVDKVSLNYYHTNIGLLVDYVVPDSPAANHCIQKNDIILYFEDQILTEPEQLGALVNMSSADEVQQVGVVRLGELEELAVKPVMGSVVRGSERINDAVLRSATEVSSSGLLVLERVVSRSLTDDNGNVYVLFNNGEGGTIVIANGERRKIFEGPLNSERDFVQVPDQFQASVKLLWKSEASDFRDSRSRGARSR